MQKQFEEHLKARKLSDKTIKQYLIYYKVMNRECGDLSQGQINQFLIKHSTRLARAFLKNFFEFLEGEGVDPTEIPKIPKIKGREIKLKSKLMNDRDALKIRKWLLKHKPYRYVLMFDLSNECALRREEVTHIKKKDFDFDEWEGGSLRLKVFAKGKERVVVVPSITARRVAKYVLKNAKKFTFEDPIFKIGIKRWHQVFKIAVRETTDHNYTLHDLRRRRATIWLDEGKDIDEVRRRLGHSSIATTQKYLIRSEEDRLEKWEEEN